MKIICGLGNPGSAYQHHRHNVGFMVLEALASRWKLNFSSRKFEGELALGSVAGEKVMLLKPQTFMNLSGTALGAAARFYKVSAEEVLVVHDELDLPYAKLQLKAGGGTGGHNGLNSIRDSWGEEAYARLRFGIGRPVGPNAKERVVPHVLGDFSSEEAPSLREHLTKAGDIASTWVSDGLLKAMNRWNGK
jgi:PTH1 family peptidyl-tRNA hydrolase